MAALLASVAETTGAGAAVVAGVNPSAAGSFAFDRNNTFGWRFTPTRDVLVSEVGYFDSSSLPGGTGAGLSQAHEAGIFRVSDQALLASATVPAGTSGVLEGGFRYQPLDAPLWLTNGVTYVMAGFALSASPDQACAATNWTMATGIIYANTPTPTPDNLTFATSQYLVSAHGNPPAVLTYPGLAQSQILPVFAANFKFVVPATPPHLTEIVIQTNSIILGITNLTVGARTYVERSVDLKAWEPLGSFIPSTPVTNLSVDTATNSTATYRLRVLP
jgi:hypothetical protein